MNILGEAYSNTKVFKIPLALTPKQMEIYESPARYKIVRAGRKFGKTTYALYQALKWLGPPNSNVWWLCQTYKQAKLIAWMEFKKLIPAESMKRKPNDTDLTITLKNGSMLYLMGTDEADTLRGPKPTAVIFEEMAQHKREVWHEIIRPNLIPNKAPALFIGTPKGFNWVKDLEDNARLSITQGGNEWAVFHYSVYDNPYNAKDEIEQARRDCDNDAVWRQEYLAEYEASVGRVFASFSDARHIGSVPRPIGIPSGRSIDWGMRDDTAGLWGYPQNNILKVHREYADNNLPASAQAGIILGMTPSDENVTKNIIGHDANKQDVELRNLTVKWHFGNAGIAPLRVGSKDKKANRQMLQQLITEDRLLIDKSCTKLRKQLLSYEWKDTVMEKTEDGNDDLVDALHSLVELYQYDLFQNRTQEKEVTLVERHKQIAQDYLNKRKFRRFTTEDDNKVPGYDFDNTPAGYLA
jgi:hypothetical protein